MISSTQRSRRFFPFIFSERVFFMPLQHCSGCHISFAWLTSLVVPTSSPALCEAVHGEISTSYSQPCCQCLWLWKLWKLLLLRKKVQGLHTNPLKQYMTQLVNTGCTKGPSCEENIQQKHLESSCDVTFLFTAADVIIYLLQINMVCHGSEHLNLYS